MLCYNAVTRNPNSDCNPQLGGDDNLSIIIGLGLTIVSLSYVGWSTTADSALGGENNDNDDDGNDEERDDNSSKEQKQISGVITNNYQSATTNDEDQSADEDGGHTLSENVPNTFSNNWKLNIALATISCWFSMVLTDFGSIHADGTMANPQIGKVNMWIIVGSQWFALLLYTWTLIAPRIFPDREFS
jgi:hypothetical protein